MSFWEKVGNWFGWVKVRNRDKYGRFVADDKSTPDVNEAWEGGEAPKKSTKKKAPAKKKSTKKKS